MIAEGNRLNYESRVVASQLASRWKLDGLGRKGVVCTHTEGTRVKQNEKETEVPSKKGSLEPVAKEYFPTIPWYR